MDPLVLHQLMGLALERAAEAAGLGEVPVGAVVARLDASGAATPVSSRHNERERGNDPAAHAEILALRDAAAEAGSWRLHNHILIVTLEPCPMCAGAAVASRIGGLVFGAADPKAGAAGSLYNFFADPRLNHECPVTVGVRADEAAAQLTAFFAARR